MKPTCPICNLEMIFKERVKSNKQYRIRRFECMVCGHQETIFADGYFDLKISPETAIKAAEKLLRDETD